MNAWTPVQDEMLILRREPTNISDRNAAVFKEDQVVGHVPFNLAASISLFLRRDISKAFAKVAGEKSTEELVMALKFLVCITSMDPNCTSTR